MPFGGIVLPLPDPASGKEWRRMWRQLAMLRSDDEKLVQDHAMTVLQAAGFLYPYFERRATVQMIDASTTPFAAAVEVPDDAPLIDRLVAWNGRDPAWAR